MKVGHTKVMWDRIAFLANCLCRIFNVNFDIVSKRPTILLFPLQSNPRRISAYTQAVPEHSDMNWESKMSHKNLTLDSNTEY